MLIIILIIKRFSIGDLHKGSNNPNWKGGRKIDSNGYVLIWKPDHPFADVKGYVLEHRLVVEEHLKCILLPLGIGSSHKRYPRG